MGSFKLEVPCSFSDGKKGSQVLAPNAHVVAEVDWRAAAMMFWRPDIQMRCPAWRGRPFRYISPDAEWRKTVPLPPIFVEECAAAPDRVFYAGGRSGLGPFLTCATQVPFERPQCGERPIVWEGFDVFKLDCACVEAKK